MRRSRQLALALAPLPSWGGRRAGAGRKPGRRPPVAHRTRPTLAAAEPAHVTLKVRADVPSLRHARLVHELERSFAAGCERGTFRLVQYSLQSNHAHLVVEAADRHALGRGMKAIASRLARAVNRVFGRRGPVLAERYHLRVLRTPREVRNVLRYVLLNARKHANPRGTRTTLDPASSARWFEGWSWKRSPPMFGHAEAGMRPVARARTWLLRVGWLRHGLLDPNDVPGPRST